MLIEHTLRNEVMQQSNTDIRRESIIKRSHLVKTWQSYFPSKCMQTPCALAHSRRLQTNSFTSFTDSKLNRAADYTALGRSLRFSLADKKAAIGAKFITTFVTVEATLMPLAANGRDDNIIEYMLFTAKATGRGTSRVTIEAPGESVLFHKRGLRIEGLYGWQG